MHRYRLAALLLGMILSVATISQAQQEQLQVTLEITNGDIGSLISIAVNAGKVADVTVDSGGDAMSLLNLSNLGKVRVEIYHEICQNGQTIRIVVEGTTVPEDENCTRRRIGGFMLGDGMRISIDWSTMTATISGGGLSTPIKIGIIAAAAGGTAAVVIVATGGDGEAVVPTPGVTPPSGSPPVSPPVTPPVTPGFVPLNGTWTGTGTLTVDECLFGFSPTAAIRIDVVMNDSGVGTLVKTHTDAGQVFNHTASATQNDSTFAVTTDTISKPIGSWVFATAIENLQVAKGTLVLTGTQVLTRTDGSSCVMRYSLNLSKTTS